MRYDIRILLSYSRIYASFENYFTYHSSAHCHVFRKVRSHTEIITALPLHDLKLSRHAIHRSRKHLLRPPRMMRFVQICPMNRDVAHLRLFSKHTAAELVNGEALRRLLRSNLPSVDTSRSYASVGSTRVSSSKSSELGVGVASVSKVSSSNSSELEVNVDSASRGVIFQLICMGRCR